MVGSLLEVIERQVDIIAELEEKLAVWLRAARQWRDEYYGQSWGGQGEPGATPGEAELLRVIHEAMEAGDDR